MWLLLSAVGIVVLAESEVDLRPHSGACLLPWCAVPTGWTQPQETCLYRERMR